MCIAQQRALVQASEGSSVQARSSYYYQPRGESAENLRLMRLWDEEFTLHNFKGVRGLRDHLRMAGHAVNEKRVRGFVWLMGHEPVYTKPRLSVPGPGVTLSVPAAGPPGHGPERSVEHRHHLNSHGPRLSLPGGRARLARAVRAQLGTLYVLLPKNWTV